MAPVSGHHLLPKVWRVARLAFEKAARAIRSKAPEPASSNYLRLQPLYARVPARQHAIHRIAAIRQSQSRYFSTFRATRRFDVSKTQASRVGSAVNRLTSRSPFASTLRPNLTGGATCRTAGGYAVGAGRIGGVRYFSSSPASPAQVVQNVSAGVRAFWLSGQRTRFDGIDPTTGAKRYRTLTVLQQEAGRKMQEVPRSAPGSYVDFQLSPTITALGCFGAAGKTKVRDCEAPTLNTPELLDVLSGDFARALKELAAVLNDLKALSTLGDLPLSLHDNSTLRVHFPGYDAESVENLCLEVGVTRGVVYQDKEFELQNGTDMALLFPFAPSQHASSESDLFSIHYSAPCDPGAIDWQHLMLSNQHSSHSFPGISGQDICVVESLDKNPWTSGSGYSNLGISELGDREFFPELSPSPASAGQGFDHGGIESIYRFIEECDRVRC